MRQLQRVLQLEMTFYRESAQFKRTHFALRLVEERQTNNTTATAPTSPGLQQHQPRHAVHNTQFASPSSFGFVCLCTLRDNCFASTGSTIKIHRKHTSSATAASPFALDPHAAKSFPDGAVGNFSSAMWKMRVKLDNYKLEYSAENDTDRKAAEEKLN